MLDGIVPPDPLVPPLPAPPLPALPPDGPGSPPDEPTGSPPLPGPPPLSEIPPEPLALPVLPAPGLRDRVGAHEAVPSASTHTSPSNNFWSGECKCLSIMNLFVTTGQKDQPYYLSRVAPVDGNFPQSPTCVACIAPSGVASSRRAPRSDLLGDDDALGCQPAAVWQHEPSGIDFSTTGRSSLGNSSRKAWSSWRCQARAVARW